MGTPGLFPRGRGRVLSRGFEDDPPFQTRSRSARAHRPIWTDPWAVVLFLLAILINGGLTVLLWRYFDTFPELIALHFSVYGDVDIIGSKADIYRLPLIGLAIWGVNGIIATVVSPRDRILARTVLAMTVVTTVLFCLGAWRIVA